MLAEKNNAIKNAVSTLYHISQDDMIRQRCERRKEYYIHEQRQKEYQEQLENDLREEIIRADSAEARADSAEARADSAEARADSAEARADSAEARADSTEAELAAEREQVKKLTAQIEAMKKSSTP